MISSEKALEKILENTQDFGVEEVPFLESLGRVLKEDILADRDFPPFNRVAMDGIAINLETFAKGKSSFTIENIQAAGSKQLSLQNLQNCIEVMTGAMLPKNTNAVIRYEDIQIENNIASIQINEVKKYQNVHLQGVDKTEGSVLISENTRISATEIAIFATVGKTKVKVAKQPKVIIIATGDELVGVEHQPKPHQIRQSNVYMLAALLKKLNINTTIDHIIDNKSILTERIKNHLQNFDVLVFSGAVSKGKFDFLPDVLKELGVQKLFHKVAQKPGKPFWFGSTKNCNVFAFPGNPVSTFLNCLLYFYPWYNKSVGIQQEKQYAILAENVVFKPELTYFLQVTVVNENGKLIAKPIQNNGSGDFVNLVDANAFIILPSHKNEFFVGEKYEIINF